MNTIFIVKYKLSLKALIACCTLVILYCINKNVYGNTNPKIEIIDSKKGLSSDNVNCVFQDSEGFLWFLTHDGINRYDGYHFKTFKPQYEFPNYFNSGNFGSCCEDSEGNLWFGSYGKGINIYNKKDNSVTIIDEKSDAPLNLSNNFVKKLYRDSKNRIWIASDQNVNLFIPDSGKIYHFLHNENPAKNYPNGIINNFYEDRHGRMLGGIWNDDLFVFDEQNWDFKSVRINSPFSNNNFVRRPWCFVEDGDSNLWIGTWDGGLLKTKLHKNDSLEILKHYTYEDHAKDGFLGNIIFSVICDEQNRIWFSTPYGLNIISKTEAGEVKFLSYTSKSEENSISSDAVQEIFLDESNIIWLSTYGGGVNKIDVSNRYFQKYTIPDINVQIKSNMVKSFYFNDNEKLFVGIRSLGFGKYSLKNNSLEHYTSHPVFKKIPPEINTANCFFKDSQENLWIGTRYFGLIQIRAGTNEIYNYLRDDENIAYVESRHVNVINQDIFGNIWAGTNNGLYKLVPQEDSYQVYRYAPEADNPYSIRSREINTLLFTSDSSLIVGSNDNGLSISVSNIQQHFPLAFENIIANQHVKSLKTNVIYDIEHLFKNKYLLATGLKGLYIFDKGDYSFLVPTNSINLENTSVYDIIPDKYGMFWLSTNKGLFQISINKNDFSIISQNFSFEDGLQGNIFIKGAVLNHQNKLYFGGYHGFNVIEPDSMKVNYEKPPLVFISIKKSGEVVNIYQTEKNKLTLTHKDYSFSTEFSALSYSKPKNSIYYYKLEGFDKEWKETDYLKREVNYTNLNAGKYKLLVYASNLNGSWKTDLKELDILVKPAPSRSWWAYTIYVLVVLSILALIYFFNIKSIKIKQALEIEKLDRLKSEKINQFKFRFFTNISHELLTPLSVISFAMEDFMSNSNPGKGNLVAIQRNVSRLMKLITQLLDFRKMETGNMVLNIQKNDANQFFNVIMESMKPLALSKNIELILEGHVNSSVYFDIDKIEKVAVNLVSNAIKYTPEYGTVIVSYGIAIVNNTKSLTFSVIDSGEGIEEEELPHVFDRFYRVKSVTGKSFGAGIGLALAKGLVEVHKGSIEAKNRKKGAVFSVTIPVENTNYSSEEISTDINSFTNELNIAQKEIYEDKDETFTINENNESNDYVKEHSVLIVEDNLDFRILLKNYLSNFYTVLEAEDGKQGLEIAKQKLPNIIVSDVMMPVMDGISMCKSIKNDMETCHIMIVLLTAKIGDSDKYQGYISGADSYIPKPVNMKILGARLKSLLDQRLILVEKILSGSFSHNIEASDINPLDKKFIKNMVGIIETNMSNPDFNVATLREEIGMSNSTLYRKTTSLLDKTPVDFIRQFRLNKAASLIKAQKTNVSEAAYHCGFNDLSYFSLCFKKQFGVLPSEYYKGS